MNARFVRSYKMFEHLKNSPHFQDYRILGNDLAVVFLVQKRARYNRPIFVGSTILEHAKYSMNQNFYDLLGNYSHIIINIF